jgi:hypothetical protein
MTMKSLTNLPTALLAGILGTAGVRAAERFMYEHGVEFSSGRAFALYGLLVCVPFICCVLGLDTKRWAENYWFTDTGKADLRQTWKRWVVYFIGGFLGYALT